MGQEINSTEFSKEDHKIFHNKLRHETKKLKTWFDQNLFSEDKRKCGLELEGWLTTKNFVPAPKSCEFLNGLNNELVVPEISRFNFELNSHPYEIKGDVFSNIERDLLELWTKCQNEAEKQELRALMIGTLPTLRDYMLTLENLSPQKRYHALNDEIMKMRDQRPITLDFEGRDQVHVKHDDVITECAATSLQIHFGVTKDCGPRYYNASIIASAFMAAVGANSPYFYGKELWDESRIPIFEQSVNLKSVRKANGEHATRVSMGNNYVRNSILELFVENLDAYPVILPEHSDADENWLNHLRLHNGTIWRWNRPLIGLEKNMAPSLRLEFRVPSAGPTVKDSVANMAFKIALVEYLYSIEQLEEKISFDNAVTNFYQACKFGFDAKIKWTDNKEYNLQNLLLNTILPKLKGSFVSLGIEESEYEKYIHQIISPRVLKGQNGANWQKAFIHTHGSRFQEMLEKYYSYQKENLPVHLWEA